MFRGVLLRKSLDVLSALPGTAPEAHRQFTGGENGDLLPMRPWARSRVSRPRLLIAETVVDTSETILRSHVYGPHHIRHSHLQPKAANRRPGQSKAVPAGTGSVIEPVNPEAPEDRGLIKPLISNNHDQEPSGFTDTGSQNQPAGRAGCFSSESPAEEMSVLRLSDLPWVRQPVGTIAKAAASGAGVCTTYPWRSRMLGPSCHPWALQDLPGICPRRVRSTLLGSQPCPRPSSGAYAEGLPL